MSKYSNVGTDDGDALDARLMFHWIVFQFSDGHWLLIKQFCIRVLSLISLKSQHRRNCFRFCRWSMSEAAFDYPTSLVELDGGYLVADSVNGRIRLLIPYRSDFYIYPSSSIHCIDGWDFCLLQGLPLDLVCTFYLCFLSGIFERIMNVSKLLYLLIVTSLSGALEGLAYLYEANRVSVSSICPPPMPIAFVSEERLLCHRPIVQSSFLPKDVGWGFGKGSIIEQGNIRSPINSLGLRGGKLQPKTKDEVRIMFVGDSSVYGFGVRTEDTFIALTADLLQSSLKKKVVAVNAAMGHSSAQSLALLKAVGRDIQPDYVVVANIWSDMYSVRPQKESSPFALVRVGEECCLRLREQNLSWIYTGADIPSQKIVYALRYEPINKIFQTCMLRRSNSMQNRFSSSCLLPSIWPRKVYRLDRRISFGHGVCSSQSNAPLIHVPNVWQSRAKAETFR